MQHPISQGLDGAAFFGRVNEPVRQNQALNRMAPPNEGFETNNFAASQI